MSDSILEFRDLHKSYMVGTEPLRVLRGASMTVRSGEFVAIMGASGSGKSTLLHILGTLDEPDKGNVEFEGVDVFSQSKIRRDRFRCQHVGFVFQFYHLLPELDVLENILMPQKIRSSVIGWLTNGRAARERARNLVDSVGISHRAQHRPSELSGGERQRAAVARALMNRPRLLLADEPTGNLDAETGRGILDLLCNLHTQGQTIVMVTHDERNVSRADRCVLLEDGQIRPR